MTIPSGILISKSRYLSGLRCDKLLWCRYHDKELIPPFSRSTLYRFEEGHRVGAYARELFPGGIYVEPDRYFAEDVVPATQEAIKLGKPLFEAGFVHGCGYCRVDVLNPVEGDLWDLYEVKSSGGYDEAKHLADVSIQRYILEGNGLKIRRCYLTHINKEYVKNGPVDARCLLTSTDITGEVENFIGQVEGDLEHMLEVIRLDKCPETLVSANCWKMGGCDLREVCWSYLPENHVLTLVSGKEKGLTLLGMGVEALDKTPGDFPLSERQAIQVKAVQSGELQVEADAVRRFLEGLEYPLSFLDFETVGPGIPVYDGTRPFEPVPFQYSLHILHEEQSKPEHRSFLARDREDPRPALADALKDDLPANGTILAYNASFERRVLGSLAGYLPGHSQWLRDAVDRVVDLYAPFRSFSVYHPAQGGSASMKAVLPALTEKSYGDLDIAGGDEASQEFLRAVFEDVPEEERIKILNGLEQYCKLDTEGMVEILGVLQSLSN